ncbi:MAG: hypothetical protein AMXMBFR64_25670 [Myxococcales bacterium]
MNRARCSTGLLALALLFSGASCGSSVPTEASAEASPSQIAAGATNPSPPAPAPASLAPTSKMLREALPPVDALALALSKAIAERRAQEAPFLDAFDRSFKERVAREKGVRRLLERVYEANGWSFAFARGAELLPGAVELIRAVEELPSHGVAVEPYRLTELQKLLADYEAGSAGYQELRGKELSGAAGKVRTLFELVRGEPSPADLAPGLLEAGLTDADVESVAEVVALQASLFEAKKALNDTLQALDIRLLSAWFRYGLDFKYVKVAHPWRAMRDPSSGFKVFEQKLLDDLEAGKGDVAKTLRSWWPDNPLYERTRAGLAFYEKLVADDRFTRLPDRTYRRGQKGDPVRKLQQRLAEEGYFSGALDGVFDERLEKAVRTYQVTHQLDVDGVVAGTTLRSMNKPYKDRIDDIRLSLQRWRESATRREAGMYIRVNIPQFQAEFWEDGKLLRRYNVVVGSNAWEVDPERRVEGNLNRTMLFSSAMETIVLNPRWTVPTRIRDTELAKLAEKDPGYWDKHNYVLQPLSDGSMQIYQKPGTWNALGLVKFLFPNDYSIYMHDTNKRHLFKNTIRAYSHGCMRVENALDMARFIFEKDGRLTPEEFDKILKKGTERGLSLRRKIPVHVEYNTVSVDDDGHVMFLLDVYKYDQAYREGQVPLRGAKPIARDG